MVSKDEEVKRNSKKDRHPGPLNSWNKFEGLLDKPRQRTTSMIRPSTDLGNNFHLANGMKEDSHFKVIPHDAWLLLHRRFGTDSEFISRKKDKQIMLVPNDMVRLSVQVPA
jgi:hypothetical protein